MFLRHQVRLSVGLTLLEFLINGKLNLISDVWCVGVMGVGMLHGEKFNCDTKPSKKELFAYYQNNEHLAKINKNLMSEELYSILRV